MSHNRMRLVADWCRVNVLQSRFMVFALVACLVSCVFITGVKAADIQDSSRVIYSYDVEKEFGVSMYTAISSAKQQRDLVGCPNDYYAVSVSSGSITFVFFENMAVTSGDNFWMVQFSKSGAALTPVIVGYWPNTNKYQSVAHVLYGNYLLDYSTATPFDLWTASISYPYIATAASAPVTPPVVDGGRYLRDGIRVQDLLPAKEAVLQNISFGRGNGLILLGILLGIALIPRILSRCIAGFGSEGFARKNDPFGGRKL